MDFDGKRVLVTGGSRGIGRAIATAFADSGAHVAFTYKNSKDAAERVLAELPGGSHIAFRSDVALPEDAEDAVERCVRELRGLDIVVNNAGKKRIGRTNAPFGNSMEYCEVVK